MVGGRFLRPIKILPTLNGHRADSISLSEGGVVSFCLSSSRYVAARPGQEIFAKKYFAKQINAGFKSNYGLNQARID